MRRAGGSRTPTPFERIRSLVIPPAWTNVWICASANGHIQATGRDAKGRKQYKYHAEYREAREQSKYEHLFAFAAALPTIRATVAEHMSLRGLPREKVLATVVHLLERTLIRVGNDEYARNNQSYGLTTLRSDHVAVEGSEVRFQFTGKSGKQWSLAMRDRRVARIVRACQELPGQDLLQYFDEDKELHAVSSGDVNAYLREITGGDITAKDFRTWAGTMLMARYLSLSDPFASATPGQARDERRGQKSRRRVGKHGGRLPQVLHPSGDFGRLSQRRVCAQGAAGERRIQPSRATGLRKSPFSRCSEAPEGAASLLLLEKVAGDMASGMRRLAGRARPDG